MPRCTSASPATSTRPSSRPGSGSQDVAALLAATNRVPVAPGDALLCPAGTPHAIGEGVLLLELQEPTDFSVLLGVGRIRAHRGRRRRSACRSTSRWSASIGVAWTRPGWPALRGVPNAIGTVLPAEADAFFVAERVGAGELAADFSIVVVTSGAGELRTERGWASRSDGEARS